ncbi:NAD(P)-dependent alcohol dehydrogenase [Kutzneria albida]|uniref:Alcohol dehydrogenase zinc-binding domain containing protein n=1 Tax=Kutzneria albida DSM 43870 TaxID=1449976 RepID=W5W2Z8_9PSEU|nr:NAD(P)-dependent alcohol dehydrogenase [Kutzneria albida]AHH95573.1 alcohol dehydrogenase zinc-binding domain containing protein [Kutzneria albida DSM 43870]
MKAVVQDRYGETDVLRCSDVDRPEPGPGEVLVRVHAAGLDPGVWHLMTGLPYLVRAMGYGLRAPKVRVRGREFAGRVEVVGADVTGFRPGDEVFGICDGAFAEYARARQDKLAPKPVNLDWEQAAAVPISATTALQALRDKGSVQPGQRVLVIGAAGGVGTFAVQLAKAFGAHVTGVCSTGKVDLVRSIGADEVVDYTREDFTGRYDLVLDTAGNRPLPRLRRALTPKGTLVIVGGEGGGRLFGGVDRVLRAALLNPFVGQRLLGLVAAERAADLQSLRRLVESGAVTPVLDRTFPLGQVPAAIHHLQSGQARGKVVITV